MDEDEVDLNQDWFYEAADPPHPIKQAPSPPIQNGGPGRGSGEYTTLNVPLEEDYPAMLQGTSQQVVYHQQRVYQQQQQEGGSYMENSKFDESMQMSSSQQMQRQVLQRQMHQQHERVLQQSENYNFPPNQQQQSMPSQQFQMIKPQQQTDWDMMQTRPNSQMQMRPDSQMQMHGQQPMRISKESQMQMRGQQQSYHHGQPQQSQQFYSEQQQYPSASNNQSFSNMPPQMQSQQNQGQMTYKQSYASSSNTQFVSSTMEGNQQQFMSGQQQGGMYVQQSFQQQPMDRDVGQRLSGGSMDQMIGMGQTDQLTYNVTPPSTSKKPLPGQVQTGSAQKQGKAVPQMIVQQQVAPQQMQSQFVQMSQPMPEVQPPPPTKKKKPSRKAPTMEDIQNKFARVGGLSFDTPQKSAEFMSILMQLQSNPNANAEERTALAERLDNLLAGADISSQQAAAVAEQASQESKGSKSKKKKPASNVNSQTIETQPQGYIPQQVFPSQPPPQISTQSKTIILDYGNSVYSTTAGSGTSFTQIPIQQSQPIGFNKGPEAGKKPARKRPPKKGAQQLQPQTLSIPVESLQNVVQTTTNQLGQQILICTQPGSATNAPVMISYENLYQPPGSGTQQIILQYQPIPAPLPQPLTETPKEMAGKIQTAQTNRENKVTKFFDDLYDRLCETDYITPFKDRGDIVDRLLPFAFNFEPDYSEEYLAKIDHEMLRRFVHLEDRFKHVENRLRHIYLNEADSIHENDYELNMLLYLDAEYEKRRMEHDKLEANKDLDSFLRESEIIRAGVDLSEVEFKKQQLIKPKLLVDPHTSSYGTYEYTEFDESLFTHVEATPPPSPPKQIQKSKKKREKSRYLDSDLEDSDEDEDDEDEIKTPKLKNPSSVTELIDLNAINTLDPEPDSMMLVRTPDADEIAANEQTEAIDKALELLPHDLENVIPFVFTPDATSKDVPFDFNLPQSSTNFVPQVPTSKSTTFGMLPPMSINSSMANTSSSFATSNVTSQIGAGQVQQNLVPSNLQNQMQPPISQLQPRTTTNKMPPSTLPSQLQPQFDTPFQSMKTPPNQSNTRDFQPQLLNFTTPTTQFQMQKTPFADTRPIPPFTLSPPKPSEQMSQFKTPQLAKEMPPPTLSGHLAKIQQPSPLSNMKSPPTLSKPGSSNNTVDKSQVPPLLAPTIPKFNAINADKNPLLNPALKMQATMSSILKPPTRLETPLLQAMAALAQTDKSLPKPLEPASIFDDPLLFKSYQNAAANQPSLKKRLLQSKPPKPMPDLIHQAKLMEQLQVVKQKFESGTTSVTPKTEANVPPLQPISSKQPELAAVSMNESARLRNSMMQKLQKKQNEKTSKLEQQSKLTTDLPSSSLFQKAAEPSTQQKTPEIPTKSSLLSTPTQQLTRQKPTDKKPSKTGTSIGIEDSDDEGQQKVPEQQKLGPPAPLDVSSTHPLSLSRPSPSNALPVRLRFKFSNNSATNGDSYSGFNNTSDVKQPPTNLPPPSSSLPASKPKEMPKLEPASFKSPKEAKLPPTLSKVEDDKELKRKRKKEKRLRKEQKKMKKEKHEKERVTAGEKAPPLKLKIRFGPKDDDGKAGEKKSGQSDAKPSLKVAPQPTEPIRLNVKEPQKEPIRLNIKEPKLNIKLGSQSHESVKEVPRLNIKLGSQPHEFVKEPKLTIKLAPSPKTATQPTEEKHDGPPVKLKIKLGKKPESDETQLKKTKTDDDRSKRSKKRGHSPNNDRPPKLEQQSTEPKVPRLKIKFGKEKGEEPVEKKPEPTFTFKSTTSTPVSSVFSSVASMSKPPPLTPTNFITTSTPIASKFSTSLIPDISPLAPSTMPLLTPTGTTMPDFSDDEMDDPKNEQLKKMTSKLVSSLTKR